MATEKNRWIDAVGKLLQLTQDGALDWKPKDPPSYLNLQPDRKRVEVVYEAQYKDRRLRLYQFSYKVEKPRSSLGAFKELSAYLERPDYPYWTRKTVLELLDQSGFGAWTFPETEVLDDLLAAVRYQAAGVTQFLDDILAAAS
jgi:hypothetical protein